MKMVSFDDALQDLGHNMSVYVQGIAMTPTALLEALSERCRCLSGVRLYHIHLEGPTPHLDAGLAGKLHDISWFVGRNTRDAVNRGAADHLPLFLSDIPRFIEQQMALDYALIQVSPPDKYGYVSLGTSVEAALSAIKRARTVVAQVNPQVPRVRGAAEVPASAITWGVWHEAPLHTMPTPPRDAVTSQIAAYVAELVPDRATLQLGIGAIPNAVLEALRNHRDLGIHSEMISDGIQPLMESGVITGRYKAVDVGLVVATFAFGSARFYGFLNENPAISLRSVDYTNDTAVIRRHPRMISINSAIEVDVTGQVAAESVGTRVVSGVGGQMDFVRGASLAPDGLSIIALPSRTRDGKPRIVPTLHPGAAVTTTRNHVQYVVTEYGSVNLHGLTLRERVRALIGLAHPADRDALERYAKDAWFL
ncbi:MAG: 4-hydroxybutyrate CoA-transferase [Firmicutes bacterium]|nr:4-hydroxybutyrate CoA-transferase [Bacillota bacterium]